jgi:hypothetical protein
MTVDYTRPQQPAPQQRGWWSRNWKWVVPAGCLSIIVFVVAVIGIILVAVFGAIRSTDAYKGALHAAQEDPRVIAALGSPIKPGLWVGGNVNVDNGAGNAEINFPISGPKGKGTVYAEAKKSVGNWTYSVLTVKVDGGSTIDLLTR